MLKEDTRQHNDYSPGNASAKMGINKSGVFKGYKALQHC